jgi:GNAT superfamily N-acetyltransferase
MSNAATDVTRLTTSLETVENLTALHVKLSKLTSVGPYLVYHDRAFARHLESIIDHPHHLFTSAPGGENFCHMRLVGDTLFLNNIFVGKAHRGSGMGRALFRESLLMLVSEEHSTVELDAFVSNHWAVAWYSRLGFIEQWRTQWYDLGVPPAVAVDSPASFEPDTNGFTQVLVGGDRKGTLVGRHALLTSLEAFDSLSGSDVAGVAARCGVYKPHPDLVTMDTSVRMRAPLSVVLERLSS